MEGGVGGVLLTCFRPELVHCASETVMVRMPLLDADGVVTVVDDVRTDPGTAG